MPTLVSVELGLSISDNDILKLKKYLTHITQCFFHSTETQTDLHKNTNLRSRILLSLQIHESLFP
jgi:hypothetical protein